MAYFLHNLGLFILRLVTGSLVSFFAAREMAGRSDIIMETLERVANGAPDIVIFFVVGAPDIVKVFVGYMILFLGAMLVIGFWTRFLALVLLLLMGIGTFYWLPQDSQFNFHIEALYGLLFFYLMLVGGGQWAVSRKRIPKEHSVLESEQSILASDGRPSIFTADDVADGSSTLVPPTIANQLDDSSEEESEPVITELADGDEDDDEEENDGSQKSLI